MSSSYVRTTVRRAHRGVSRMRAGRSGRSHGVAMARQSLTTRMREDVGSSGGCRSMAPPRTGEAGDTRRSLPAAGSRACGRSPGVRARISGAQRVQTTNRRRARARARVHGVGLQSSILSRRTPHRLQLSALRRRGRNLAGVGRWFRRAATDARPWDASDRARLVARRTTDCLAQLKRQRGRRHLGHSRRRQRRTPGDDGSWRRE